MIDPHVHLRDWLQVSKETVKNGLKTAQDIGLDGVFEMPNTDPVITSAEAIQDRIDLGNEMIGDLGIEMFHGIYGGVTDSVKQIEEIVEAQRENDRVVALKMFAGHSTGNMGLIEGKDQRQVYKTLAELGYKGVLAVHCEKESKLRVELWDPKESFTHTIARPPESEIESVKDQLKFAHQEGYKGTLHICHLSVPDSLEVIERARKKAKFKITTEVAPHHVVMYDELMDKLLGYFLKMNPPLRPKYMQESMLQALLDGRIDMIGTDHAPHTSDDKKKDYASGIPGFPYYPYFIEFLKQKGMSKERLDAVTHDNIVKTFEVDIPNTHRVRAMDKKELNELAIRYEYDGFEYVRNLISERKDI
ncbi:dihydroorotase [Nanoarchaeota archaeon]